MSRPCTDWPITRVSVTNDGAAVVVVLVDVVVLDVVVDGGIEVVVDGAGTAGEVVPTDVAAAVGVGALAADDDVSDPDEHDNIISGATSSAHPHARLVIVTESFNSE
ncbi:MAG: hypothetical protein QOJ66_2827 [Ilumatobacteraceae bacterium]